MISWASCKWLSHCCLSPPPSLLVLALPAGFKMFAVGVGNAVEDELREIASEPVAEHYFYTADFKTINQIGMKLQKKICVGEQGQGWPGWAGQVGLWGRSMEPLWH